MADTPAVLVVTTTMLVKVKTEQNRLKGFLVVQGVDHLRVKTEGYGPDKPIDTNDTQLGRSKNRRVEVKVLRR